MKHSEVSPHNFGLRGEDTVWARDHQLLVNFVFMVAMQVVFEWSKHFCGVSTEAATVWLCPISHFLSRRFPERNISPWCVKKVLLSWIKAFKVLQQLLAAVKPNIHKNAFHLFPYLPDVVKIFHRNLKHFWNFPKSSDWGKGEVQRNLAKAK